MFANYGKYMLQACEAEYVPLSQMIEKRFQSKDLVRYKTCFARIELEFNRHSPVFDQTRYAEKVIRIPILTNLTTFRSLLANFALTQQIRLDVTFDAATLLQVTKKKVPEHLKRYTKAALKIQRHV